MLRLFY